MKQQLERRLVQLESELESGHRELAALEERRVRLLETLLRISGAAQVVRELLAEPSTEGELGPASVSD